MLCLKDTRCESVPVIIMMDDDSSLQDDRSMVHLRVHEMRGTSGDLHPILEGITLTICSFEGGKQGWMNVDEFPMPFFHKPW